MIYHFNQTLCGGQGDGMIVINMSPSNTNKSDVSVANRYNQPTAIPFVPTGISAEGPSLNYFLKHTG